MTWRKLHFNPVYQDFHIMKRNPKMKWKHPSIKVRPISKKWERLKTKWDKWFYNPIKPNIKMWRKIISVHHRDLEMRKKVLHLWVSILWRWVGRREVIMLNFLINDILFSIYLNKIVFKDKNINKYIEFFHLK